MLWPVDADEIAFVTPLYVDAGRRVREEAEMVARSEDANLERDASLLFAMPIDELPDAFLENASSSSLGLAGREQESDMSGPSLVSFGRTSLQSPIQCLGGWPEFESDLSDGDSQSSVQSLPALPSADTIHANLNNMANREPQVNIASEDDMDIVSPYMEMMYPSPPFIPRTVPDPFGEIPAHFDEARVRVCEAHLVVIREYCVQRGLRGLGLSNVPELALTMSTATLLSAPVTPHCTWWPPSVPVVFEPRAPSPVRSEPTLPFGMRVRLFVSDLGRVIRRAFVGHELERS